MFADLALVRHRGVSTVVAVETAKRAVRSAAVWGVLFGLLVLNEGLGYHANFGTADARAGAVAAGNNGALTAVVGPGRELDTIGGWMAWRTFGLLLIVGAVWGLLTSTRLMRREEDTGRWELLLAGHTDRRNATTQALVGLGVGFAFLWSLVSVLTIATGASANVDLTASACVFYATAIVASAAIFLAVGALTSQLAATRRQADMMGSAVLGAFYLIRMVADSGGGLAWLRWASPLGWVENLRPFTGSQPLALVPIILFVAAACAATVLLAGRRDTGVGAWSRTTASRTNVSLLHGPFGLTIRLERWVGLSWVVGLGLLATIFGVTAATVGSTSGSAYTVEEAVSRLGVQASGVRAWIGYEFIYIAALVMYAAASQLSAVRGEEADSHLDNLLARRIDRHVWLAGRAAWVAAVVVCIGLAAGVGGWAGLAAGGGHVPVGPMLQAGLNVAVPALFVLGVGVLLFGLVPRIAAPLLYVVVLWSFLIEIIGTSITTNHWLLDTAVLTHIGPVPASGLNWHAVAILLGLGVLAAVVGTAAFTRRDLDSD